MYIMQSEREALQRMVHSFANEYGLSVRTRDFDATQWTFYLHVENVRVNPRGFTILWDKVESIYESFKAIENAVLSENPSLAAVHYGKMLVQGFVDGTKGSKLTIKDVMFKPPATIVFWSDGSKTVVKTQKDDKYDPEKGLSMAISKRFLGNSGRYYNIFAKWLEKATKPIPIIPENIVYHQDVIPVARVGSDGKLDMSFMSKMLGRWKNP